MAPTPHREAPAHGPYALPLGPHQGPYAQGLGPRPYALTHKAYGPSPVCPSKARIPQGKG